MKEPLFKKPVLWESHFIAYIPKISSLTKKWRNVSSQGDHRTSLKQENREEDKFQTQAPKVSFVINTTGFVLYFKR